MSISVIVAEDDYLMRGDRRILESAPDITVLAECADGQELLAAIDLDAGSPLTAERSGGRQSTPSS